MTTVIALRRGVIGGKIVEPNTVFDIDPKKVSKRWMAKKGTPEYKAAVASAQEGAKDGIDHLTGERVAAGGMPEQIAVLQEERNRLSQKVADLEARLADLLDDRVKDTPEKVEPVDAGTEANDAQPADEETEQAPVSKRRTRRTSKE